MAELVAYTCINITCDGYGERWPVEVDENGQPVDEADGVCPDCYGRAMPVAGAASGVEL